MATKTKQAPTAEQREQWNADRAEAIKAAHEQIADAIADITTSDEWKKYLRFAASKYTYSFNNQMLLWSQARTREMAPLGMVKSFNAWKKAGHNVLKGQKGLRIFAPIIVLMKEGEPGYAPGKSKVVGFKVVSVFDQQQVDGQDKIPTDPTRGMFRGEVTGKAPDGLRDALIAFAKESGYSYRYATSSTLGGAEAHTDPQAHEIVMDAKWQGSDREVPIMFHEIAHMILHTEKDDDGHLLYDYRAHRGMAETEAEGTAFVLATYFGIDMGQTSAGYIAGWSKTDPAAIVKAGTRIMATAKKIITATEKEMGQ